ncbi:hypothetical protein A10D4_01847 [Idiomarina xiamenensis 10-D-4]|uniref:Large ribosomal RNA subunit accumulation protein YceD n=2 Tax=Idiomarina xiamenensis TaxID=1207041 RepID=K2LAV1_9GAMM|nr:hypothetical protein A10D4_01847 [Idiomarina xiamenensis 10-D-4]
MMVDPVKSAGKQLTYDGLVPASALQRFQGMLVETCADPEVVLNFLVDEQGLYVMQGQASVTAKVSCERCGEPLTVDVAAQFAYAPVTRKQTADNMPDAYEPIEPNEFGEINVHGVVEDELILAMPIVVKHDESDCKIDPNNMSWGEIDETPAEHDNPFAVLQDLKRK